MSRLVALDGLRGVFALMIVVLHSPVDHHLLNSPIVRNSHIAVEFFFVLSGFVITASYGDRLNTSREVIRFALLRLGRLWPLHAFMIGMFLLFFLAQYAALRSGPFVESPSIWPWVLRDLAFLNAFANEKVWILNFPSWSINAEYWAYLVFAAVATRFAVVPGIMIGCWLVIMGWVTPEFGATWGWSLFRAVFYFFVGSITYKAWIRYPVQSGIAEVFVIAACVCLFLFLDQLPSIASPIIFSFTIFVFASPGGALGKILISRPFKVIGERSYSIYMSHVFIIMVIGTAIKKVDASVFRELEVAGSTINALSVGSPWVMDAYIIAQIALIVWLSGLLSRWIEVPGQRLTRRILVGRKITPGAVG